MKAPIFKQRLVSTLWANIEANYELYMEGDFSEFLANPEVRGEVREVEQLFVREEEFLNLEPKSGGKYDAYNANIIYEAFQNMSPNLAYDERIWVAATHTFGLEFTRKRWLIAGGPKETNIKAIKRHFFARVEGTRGIHRNNAISSLWWWAYVIARSGKDGFIRRLETFLTYTDLRAQIMERPVSSRTPLVFDAIIDCVIRKIEAEPNTKFFTRQRVSGVIPPYRQWMMQINLLGGHLLYNSLTVEDLSQHFDRFMELIEKDISDQESL